MNPRNDPPPVEPPDWQSDYEEWCQEQDDADEINRMLDEANHDDE